MTSLQFPLDPVAIAGHPLHAPDGFFSPVVVGIGWVVTVGYLAVALKKTDAQLNERMVPLMGVLAAFVFAAQMLNFPVAGGTSGHFIGGAFAAMLLGPWAAALVMAAVVATQAILFQDGGLVSLGVNIMNMGVLSIASGYALYKFTEGLGPKTLLVRAFAGAWLSVVVSAAAAAVELAVSGTTALELALPAMVGIHMLIGVGEGLITVAALSFISATRRDLLTAAKPAA